MGPNQQNPGQEKEMPRKVYNLTPEKNLAVPEELRTILSPDQIRRFRCLPIRKEEDGTIVIAAERADDFDLNDKLRLVLGGKKFKLEAYDAAKILKSVDDPYGAKDPKTTIDLSVDKSVDKTVDISPGERMPAGYR